MLNFLNFYIPPTDISMHVREVWVVNSHLLLTWQLTGALYCAISPILRVLFWSSHVLRILIKSLLRLNPIHIFTLKYVTFLELRQSLLVFKLLSWTLIYLLILTSNFMSICLKIVTVTIDCLKTGSKSTSTLSSLHELECHMTTDSGGLC